MDRWIKRKTVKCTAKDNGEEVDVWVDQEDGNCQAYGERQWQ